MPTTELTFNDLLDLKEKVEEALEDYSIKTLKQEPRSHLGMSEIGKACSRQLWYKFRWFDFPEFSGRMLRLFNRGHREEERYVSYLEGIGCKVFRFDENGKQFRSLGVMGHYGGSCDGVVITPWFPNIPFIAEFKTHNTNSFSKYAQPGIKNPEKYQEGLLKTKPEHYDQMCSYGWKLQIQYGLYFPENKNDDDIRVTPIKLDWSRAYQLEQKAFDIITAKIPPAKISDNPAFQECKFCAFNEYCHKGKLPLKNCRSCRNAEPVENGEWKCNVHSDLIPKEFIAQGCNSWMPI